MVSRPTVRSTSRRGLGSALLVEVIAAAEAAGCERLSGAYAAESGEGFAQAKRTRATERSIRSLLLLQEAKLEQRHVPGFRLESWVGAAPDTVVASYGLARNAINDAPAVADGEWHAWDVAKVRDLEQVIAKRGRQIRVTVAVDASERVVAYTELRVSPPPVETAVTEDTAVVAEGRGRGLASAIKCESLRRLRDERPDIRFVPTLNAETNLAMLAINRRLGFQPVATFTHCELTLAGNTS